MALRVLVDATDVPTDRGALGRYVDGLIGALAGTGVDLAVACQRADDERYARLAPGAAVVAGPVGIGHRSERHAWEQSGLPFVAEQVGADVLHMPNYSMPLRPGLPTVVTIHDLSFFTDPDRYTQISAVSRRSSSQTRQRGPSARLQQISHSPIRSLTSWIACASASASSSGARRM